LLLDLQHVTALSDERDQWQRRIAQAWRDGYEAGEQTHAEDYGRGVIDGATCRKRAEQDLVEWARLEVARWGPAGRARFGDRRPGDYPGRGAA
jgi:hypothetical protein